MRRFTLIVLACLVVPLQADDAEIKKFSGTWKVKEGTDDGIAMPAEVREAARIVFDGKKFSFKSALVEQATTFEVDVIKGTITIAPPKGETKPLRGRYKFEGKLLTLTLTDKEDPPIDFKPAAGRMTLLLERER